MGRLITEPGIRFYSLHGLTIQVRWTGEGVERPHSPVFISNLSLSEGDLMMRRLSNVGIVLILFSLLFSLQVGACFSQESNPSVQHQAAPEESESFEHTEAGIEAINNIIQHYCERTETSLGKREPQYFIILTNLDLLKNEKVAELTKKIDEIKQEGDEKALRQAVSEVLNDTDADALAIVEKIDHKEGLGEMLIICVSVLILLIILSTLFLTLKEEWSHRVRNSIRPIISLSLTSLVFMLSWYGLYKNLIEFKDLFTLLLSLYGPIIGFWFGERSALKMPGKVEEYTIAISPETLPTGKVGDEYKANLSAMHGTAPYTWKIEKGNLPQGLEIDSEGTIEGTPEKQEQSEFIVKATDGFHKTGSKKYKVVIQ